MSDSQYSKLSKILTDIDIPDAPKRFAESQLFQDFNEAAGEAIAANTLNLSVDGPVLNVSVNSPTWAHELINNQSSILEKLIELDYSNLKELAIRVNVAAAKKKPRLRTNLAPQTSERTVNPELKDLFVDIAEKSANSNTRKTFLRLSRLIRKDK